MSRRTTKKGGKATYYKPNKQFQNYFTRSAWWGGMHFLQCPSATSENLTLLFLKPSPFSPPPPLHLWFLQMPDYHPSKYLELHTWWFFGPGLGSRLGAAICYLPFEHLMAPWRGNPAAHYCQWRKDFSASW